MTDAVISMAIPAQSRFVALARVTTASLGAELDFTVDEIEELRVGANELVAFLVEWAEDNGVDRVDLRYRVSEDTVELSGTAGGDPEAAAEEGTGADPLDDLTRQILSAVVDEYEIEPGRGRIAKRRTAT